MRLESSPALETFRAEVRAFIEKHSPGRKAHAGTRAPDAELIGPLREWNAELYRAGYLGIGWPQEYGGRPDAHPLESSIVAEELTRAHAWGPVGGGELAATALIGFGTAQQQAQFLPRISSGADIWCQLFSEPGAGSDLASLSTRARRGGDSYVVDGQKVWTTNGQHADVGYLLARTDPDSPKHRGITAFALDMRTPGIDVRPLREITGTTDFNEVFFDNVVVPAERAIGEVNAGWRVAMDSLGHERSGVAAGGVALRLALADLVGLAAGTEIDGRPALEDGRVRQDLGAFTARIDANAAVTALVQSNLLAGKEDPADAAAAKIAFAELNLDLATYGMSMQGTDAILVEGDPDVAGDGWWQDAFLYARAYTISGGANEILRNVIAERGLGMPREPA